MTARRRSGRERRHQVAAAPPAVNPAPPGQRGGTYKPLSDADCHRIYRAALDLLRDLGMGEVPERLAHVLIKNGAQNIDNKRISITEGMVDSARSLALSEFVFHGRDPKRSITLGGERVHFGTGGAAVQVLDIEDGLYRAATLRDLHDFTRLQDALTNISWFTRCCIATDIEDIYDLDVNTLYALLANTTRPVGTAFTIADHVAPLVEMLDIAAGGPGAFAQRPWLKAHISPVISPMRFGEDAVDVLFACVDHNIPVSLITAAQAGATAPATLAGFLAQSLAETLASLVMMQCIAPGHPMIFSNWPLVIDLRTGAFAGGGGEIAVLNAASAQMCNWLGLPGGVAASMTDAKASDAQHGAEKAMTSLAAALAGGNLIYESSGMTASLLGASFEAFVLDDEMHGATYRALRGIEVNDETLDLAAMREAILGEGHYLGGQQTLQAMTRDYVYPSLANRDIPRVWAESGAPNAWDVARQKALDILQNHRPSYLSPEQDAAIRDRFSILN